MGRVSRHRAGPTPEELCGRVEAMRTAAGTTGVELRPPLLMLGTSERVAAVACVPDESRGERLVVLYVEPALAQHGMDVAKWQQALAGRGLPNLWVPGPRDFYAVPELPHLGSGKLDLKRLKDVALEVAKK